MPQTSTRGWRTTECYAFLDLCHEWHALPSDMLGESKYWRLRMQEYLAVKRRMEDVDRIEADNERQDMR